MRGPVTVEGDVTALSPRDRVVLSALVAHGDLPSSTDGLSDVLWGSDDLGVGPQDRAGLRRPAGQVGPALHNANRHHTIDGPAITVSPLRATLSDSRPSCRDAILDAIARLQARTGATEFARCFIVAEVQATDASFERQTIYRCLRRLAGHEPGSAHRDLEEVDGGRLRVRR